MNVREAKSRNRISLGQDGNALMNLIIFNVVLFVLLQFIFAVYLLSEMTRQAFIDNIFSWFTLPADISKLGTRPWAVFTAMFTHEFFFHFLGNMLCLGSFGYILQELTGNRKLVPIYIYGGLAGGFFYVLSCNIFPAMQPGIPAATYFGANASVMAVAVATTTVSPDYRLFPMINGGIPLWIVTLIYVVIDLVGIKGGNPAQYIAHLSGAALGFVFIYQMRKGKDWSEWMNNFFDWVENLFNPDKKSKRKSAKDEFFYKVKEAQPYKKTPNVTQKRVDEILDKINQKGFRFLTDEEKDILKRAANGDDL